MRVLHCIWRMGIGGAERQLIQLSAGLIRSGIDVHVATAYPADNDAPLKATGVTTHRLSPALKYDLTMIPRLWRLIRRLKPDVVTTWLTQMDIAAGLAAEIGGVPWVLCERCSVEAYPAGLIHSLREQIGARADAIVANAEVGREYWRSITREPIHVIPNIVPLKQIESATIDASTNRDIILFVGRLAEQKNLELLTEALKDVFAQSAATAIFCGDGQQRSVLEQKAANLGISERVQFLGAVPNVWSWMKRAAVVVSVSLFEGDPNVVLEAIACGTPLVVSDIAAHRALLDESSAWIVDPHSATAVAAGLLAALGDRVEAHARADRARDVVAARTSEEIAARYVDVFESVMRRPA
jgi:GalNAc-alpha-(1->4)-GalNAc-alpha-(1->3)-diNAcBac-PP-undecaprenol alpha-1,4-N-acetyl-D-galactosaminyltransferase